MFVRYAWIGFKLERGPQMGGVSGHIYYILVPTTDVERSATFYREVFGWNIRERGDGSTAFDDASGNVSGSFTTEQQAVDDPGFSIFIGSDDIASDCESVRVAGGTVTMEPDLSAVDIVAKFRDPAGNQWGIHQYKPENAS
jgi:uncharacterized protein